MQAVLGIDIGGTFTDACAVTDDGRVLSTKTPSTPPDYGQGVMNTVEALAPLLDMSAEELLASTAYICHGTTSTLNALVTGDVAKVGFVTTRGHSDSIVIMNVEGRYAGLDPERVQDILRTSKPDPLVPRARRAEIDERIDYAGEVVVPLDEDGARAAAAELIENEQVDALAVSFLWSFRNSAHEDRFREIVEQISPDTYVGLSHEISPRIGEYGRDTTTIMSSQVAPKLRGYLQDLGDKLNHKGFGGKLLIMQGTGGVVSAEDATRHAIVTVGSVLTGGVIGAVTLGNQLGHQNVIATDMGGTTFLVGLVVDGEPKTTTKALIGQHQVNVPMVEIHTIGSGGGAIAWLDPGGNLKVGPRSAGARPGPACYGAGGHEPTITDADVILGLVDPENFLGGDMKLDRGLAEEAIKRVVGDPLGLSVEDAAAAIFAITNAQTADAVRHVVVNNGYDPRDFVLYSYGGAGPVHCAHYARDLGCKEVLVPLGPTASAFSAFGLAAADVVVALERSAPAQAPVPAATVNEIYEQLEAEAKARIEQQELVFASVEFNRELDVRYSAQMAEVSTPVAGGVLDEDGVTDIIGAFERRYEEIYGEGTGFSAAGFEFITYRIRAIGRLTARPELPEVEAADSAAPPPVKGRRRINVEPSRGWEEADVYDYRVLKTGHVIDGPALVEAITTTVVVPGDAVGRVDNLGNLAITFGKDA
jgi:N-methylhydantoinase A